MGSGKNKKSLFCLLGLKITLRTCFESNNFLLNSCPELSNQVCTQFFSLSNFLVVSEMDWQIQFQFFTSGGQLLTYWMILIKVIPRMVFLRFGEIPVLTSFAHPASGWQVEKCTKFRWFFGVWENLVFCFQDLLTFSNYCDFS